MAAEAVEMYSVDAATARAAVPDVGLLRGGGRLVSKPHLDAMHTEVDEMGSDVWYGEVPAGPDGEPRMPDLGHFLHYLA